MKTGLFEIQADHLNGLGSYNIVQPASRQLVYALFEPRAVVDDDEVPASAHPFAKCTADLRDASYAYPISPITSSIV
jgi:hypothetical protein